MLSLDLYKKLFLIRRAEEYIVKYYAKNEMKCPMHMSMGQEAISVGVCAGLKPADQVCASYRSHAAFLAKTGDTDLFFGELCGRTSGTAKGKSGSMHLAAPDKGFMGSSGIVGSNIPLAVGAAFANKYLQVDQVACVFFGDGALDEGVFWESLNVACVKNLPVLFVVEDNGYAVETPVRVRQGFESITNVARKFECNAAEETTTDVEIIYQLALWAREKIQATESPTLLHFKCRRYLEHVGINKNSQPRKELIDWYPDCVDLQRNRLLTLGYMIQDLESVEEQIDKQIWESLERARIAPYPEEEDLYKGIFYV